VYRKYKTSAEISAGGKEYTKDVGSDEIAPREILLLEEILG
jgi:hypothetical protein